MKKKIDMEQIKKYWLYDIIKENYNIKIIPTKRGANVYINYLGGVKFEIEEVNFEFQNRDFTYFECKVDDYNIGEELEFRDTLEDSIKSCLYYFNTRY